jgi:DNA topoisomerase-1
VYRFGKKGRFLSCGRYPKCKFAAPVDREGNPVAPEQTDMACPKCESPMLLRKGRFGLFLSCMRYPECDGILNLDKKGLIAAPKTPPLATDLSCPKCNASMNLRRGARGPWLSCSKFPKCRGRIGWSTLEESNRNVLETALQAHEKLNPQAMLRKTDGTAVTEGYKPQPLSARGETADQEDTGEA